VQAAEAGALRAAQEATVEPTPEPTATATATVAPTATPLPTPAQVGLAGPDAPAAGAEVAAAPPPTRTGFGLDWLTLAAVTLGGVSLLLFGLWLLSRTRPGAR
jgi:hypothetical protein